MEVFPKRHRQGEVRIRLAALLAAERLIAPGAQSTGSNILGLDEHPRQLQDHRRTSIFDVETAKVVLR